MIRTSTLGKTGAALLGMALLFPTQAYAQEVKGQVKIGVHKIKLDKDKIYEVIVESEGNSKPAVALDYSQGRLTYVVGRDFKDNKVYFLSTKADTYEFYVMPPFVPVKSGVLDYTLKFKGLSFADKPLVEDQNKFTDKDPIYTPPQGNFGPDKSHYKPYKVQMKAGQLYVIDHVRKDNSIDPYLFVEGPDGKIVAQDDDSGGNLNARIIYMPQKDGEYRVIATTLGKAVGDYTLTVRNAKE